MDGGLVGCAICFKFVRFTLARPSNGREKIQECTLVLCKALKAFACSIQQILGSNVLRFVTSEIVDMPDSAEIWQWNYHW